MTTQIRVRVHSGIAAGLPPPAPVTSVAGRTGAVTLAVADVTGAAPLGSPALTGVPTAPTAAPGTNTTQVATTAFVAAAVPAAPVTSVAGRTGAVTLAVADVTGAAPLGSPALTGVPTAPTAAPGTNTTQVATTAFVAAAVPAAPVTSVAGRTGAVTLAVADVTGAAPLGSPALTGVPTAPTAAPGTNTTQVATTAFVAASAPTAASIGALVYGATDNATPVDEDLLAMSDSAAAGILKKLSLGNLKAALGSLFIRLAGTAGGQTLTGGTAAGDNLTLRSTSHATRGAIVFGTASEYDEVNNRLGIGTLTPSAKVHVLATTEQMRLGYDAANYCSITVSDAGALTIDPTGKTITITSVNSTATLGTELVANGGFDSNLSSWTDSGASWSWSAGTALHTAGSISNLSQNVTVVNGSTYQVEVTVTGRTVGSIAVALGSVSVVDTGVSTVFTASLSRTVVAGETGSVSLSIVPTVDFNGSIDNVSIKLVTLGSATVALSMGVLQIRGNAVLGCSSTGTNAQRSLTTGASNTATGTNAQYSLTTGANNTAAGMDAQYNLTIGAGNTATGTSAQRSLTTGASNTAAGKDAQYSLTVGASNTATGTSAQRSLTTGVSNTAAGMNAQYNLTTGVSNTAAGMNAQYNLTTGANNTAIGTNAQRYLADGTTPTTSAGNSTYAGALTKASANGVTNENVFGYNATGIGSNTVCIGSSAITKCQVYGDIVLDKTVTAAGTTGAQTINKTVGTVNFAAGATSLVVTNNRVSTTSVIIATVATNDTTLKSVIAVAASGSFTLYANAAATAETRVNFIVIN